jgi:Sec7-like guanine-nucleotide exchange factor
LISCLAASASTLLLLAFTYQLSEFLNRHSGFVCLTHFREELANAYIEKLIPLKNIAIDVGLRMLMERILLPSVTGRVSSILWSYSSAFWRANQLPLLYGSESKTFFVVYSIVLLNVDLHNPAIKKKMSRREFVKNTKALLSDKAMYEIYDRIKQKPLGIQPPAHKELPWYVKYLSL